MDAKVIENALKDYKRKKSIVETTLARIENYKKAINNPESFTHIFLGSPIELGMPKSTGSKISPVEMAVTDKEKAIEILKQWIKDEHSRIYPYQIELEQIDGALEALTMQQRFIIECKYFENMFWRDIEISFNDKFRQQNYITYEGLKKINKETLNLLAKILEPYYMRFKIIKS
ncbi:hypothetical protein [Tepidimicrobium xylanilyticum]|uniref:Uncharacterized protein n=1 Tax=Tepidimicrobium xylanilyticum TaxID=1123352 RepID=A0A1H3EJE4_9FIRM|nr:hypothetical protein [Tepidimicrobium xylanilyticum]SDX78318.1 hypothetical protein SAMN05660923_02921 [Tepidimicrobium xylanilyticum]